MQRLHPDALPPGSSFALVMRGSAAAPQYLLATEGGTPACLARWRRRRSAQAQPVRLREHVLSYCLAGHARGPLVIDGVHHATDHRPRSAFWLPAGSSVHWTLEAPVEMDHLHLYLAADVAAPGHLPPALPRDPWLDGFFTLLAAEHEAQQRRGAVERSTLLDELLPRLLRHLRTLAPPPAAGPHRVSALRPHLLQRLQAHVQAHLAKPLPLDELAGLAGQSVDHFVRAFRLATGLTPHQFLLAQRLDRAAAALRETTTPVTEIAHRCGFASGAHFTAAFRRQRGLTPTEWRRRA